MSDKQGPVVLVVGGLYHEVHLHTPMLPTAGEDVTAGPWRPGLGGRGARQAVAAAKAGRARLLAAIGSDPFAATLLDGLRLAGVEDDFLQRREAAGTGLALRMELPDGSTAALHVPGANTTVDAGALADPEIWRWVGLLLLQADLPEQVNLAAATEARGRGLPVMLHLAAGGKPVGEELLGLVTHVVLDQGQMERLGLADKDVEGLAATLWPGLAGLILMGEGQGFVARDRGRVFTLPAARDVQRGHPEDLFCGTLATALARGLPLEPACLLARKAMGRGGA